MSKLKIFTAYSHEDASFRQHLNQHLSGLKRQELVEVWFDGEILAGTEWDAAVKGNLSSSDIIIPLISPAFIASDYCWNTELKHALDRHTAGTGCILPAVIRPCDWKQPAGINAERWQTGEVMGRSR